VVVEIQPADDLGENVGGDGLLTAVLVVFRQAGLDDTAGDRQASVAAERTFSAEDREGLGETWVERKTAVEAAVARGRGRSDWAILATDAVASACCSRVFGSDKIWRAATGWGWWCGYHKALFCPAARTRFAACAGAQPGPKT